MSTLGTTYFTYYGDLLGISELYIIEERIGYSKLNFFYNKIFELFRKHVDKNTRIFVFSDSLIITSNKIETILNCLGRLYIILIEKELLLKGAMVKGHLQFDPRIELDDLTKRLPMGDVLYRAVALEKKALGARLIIEKQLAHHLLPDELHGATTVTRKFQQVQHNYDQEDIRLKIRWNADLHAYDFLWLDYRSDSRMPKYYYILLRNLSQHVNRKAKHHYTETLRFIKRFYKIQ